MDRGWWLILPSILIALLANGGLYRANVRWLKPDLTCRPLVLRNTTLTNEIIVQIKCDRVLQAEQYMCVRTLSLPIAITCIPFAQQPGILLLDSSYVHHDEFAFSFVEEVTGPFVSMLRWAASQAGLRDRVVGVVTEAVASQAQHTTIAWQRFSLSDLNTVQRQGRRTVSAENRLKSAGFPVGRLSPWSRERAMAGAHRSRTASHLAICGFPLTLAVRSPSSFASLSSCEKPFDVMVVVEVADWLRCPVRGGCREDTQTSELQWSRAELETCSSQYFPASFQAFDPSAAHHEIDAAERLYEDVSARYKAQSMFRVCMYKYLSDDGFAGHSGLLDAAGEDVLAGLSVGAKLGCFDQGEWGGQFMQLGVGLRGFVLVLEDATTGQQISDAVVSVVSCGVGDVTQPAIHDSMYAAMPMASQGGGISTAQAQRMLIPGFAAEGFEIGVLDEDVLQIIQANRNMQPSLSRRGAADPIPFKAPQRDSQPRDADSEGPDIPALDQQGLSVSASRGTAPVVPHTPAASEADALRSDVRFMQERTFLGWSSVRQDMLRSTPCPSGRLRFTILTVAVPQSSHTLIVFEELAETLHQGLLELGHQSQRRECVDLASGCAMTADVQNSQVIMVGGMVAVQYTVSGTDMLAVERAAILPDDAIIFNFEFIDKTVLSMEEEKDTSNKYWVGPKFLRLHSLYRVWEYSYHNHQAWRHHGIESTLVPVGYMPWLTDTSVAEASESERDIDVLFFGVLTPPRKAVLAELKRHGVNVTVSETFVHGQALLHLVRRAKVVVILRTFGHGTEFKMSRLMVLLANKVFVVTQQMGVPQDVEWLRGGMVEVHATQDLSEDSMELLQALRYWLAAPGLRREVSRRGFELYRARRQSGLLEEAVGGLVSEGNRHCVDVS